MYFPHAANNACPIIHLDPYHQLVLDIPSHFIEKLQALNLPLWIEGSGFQQSWVLRVSNPGVQVHEVPSICKTTHKKNRLWCKIPLIHLVLIFYFKRCVSGILEFWPLHLPRSVWSSASAVLLVWTQSTSSVEAWIIPQMLAYSNAHWSSRVSGPAGDKV